MATDFTAKLYYYFGNFAGRHIMDSVRKILAPTKLLPKVTKLAARL